MQCSKDGLNRTGGGLLYQVSQGGWLLLRCSWYGCVSSATPIPSKLRPSVRAAAPTALRACCSIVPMESPKRLSVPRETAAAPLSGDIPRFCYLPKRRLSFLSLHTKGFINNAEAVIQRDKNMVQVRKGSAMHWRFTRPRVRPQGRVYRPDAINAGWEPQSF